MLTMVLVVLTGIASGSAPVRDMLHVGGTDAVFQYDDGTALWLTWGGLYRGVWFHSEDFAPDASGFLVDTLEYWFYHSSAYSWDVVSFYAEIYSGGSGGPADQLFSESVTASHYMPVYVPVDPPIDPGADFWVMANTGMSGGGWPALLGDGTPQTGFSHSFFSDDFIVWEPWVVQGELANDYFIRAHGVPVLGLEPSTWGSIKVLFGGTE